MAAINRETKNGANISFVYTPKEYRGKGYASAITAYLCKEILQGGKKLCMLFGGFEEPNFK